MSRSKRFDASRRQFLQQTLASVGYLSLMQGSDAFIKMAKAAGPARRRHLVTIAIWGGWDSAWFHNSVARRDLTELGDAAAQYASQVQISENFRGFEPYDPDEKKFLLTVRHRDDEGMMHPYASTPTFMGAGMKSVFSSADLANMLIWNGLKQEGQHGIGNFNLVQGTNSSYALSFSAIIARGIAEADYQRPLHYTMVADNPGQLFANEAMNTGSAVPVCIGDHFQFTRLTQSDPNDLKDIDRRKVLSKTIESLSELVLGKQLLRKTSRDIATQFATSYRSALTVTGANLTDTVEFNLCVKRMYVKMVEGLNAFFTSSDMPARQADVRQVYTGELASIAGQLSPLPDADLLSYRELKAQSIREPANTDVRLRLEAARVAILPKLRDLPGSPHRGGSGMAANLYTRAYHFGKAAYLVSEDLSAVVDIGAGAGGDPHGNYLWGLFEMTTSMIGFRELTRFFRETILPDGTPLLDSTTVVMHTELDREQWLQPHDFYNSPNVKGTNHALSTSVLIAGMGIRRGQVVGGVLRSPKDAERFKGHEYAHPLPINPRTGIVTPLSEGGSEWSTKAVLPTLCKIFDVAVPNQQITEVGPLPAVLGKG